MKIQLLEKELLAIEASIAETEGSHEKWVSKKQFIARYVIATSIAGLILFLCCYLFKDMIHERELASAMQQHQQLQKELKELPTETERMRYEVVRNAVAKQIAFAKRTKACITDDGSWANSTRKLLTFAGCQNYNSLHFRFLLIYSIINLAACKVGELAPAQYARKQIGLTIRDDSLYPPRKYSAQLAATPKRIQAYVAKVCQSQL